MSTDHVAFDALVAEHVAALEPELIALRRDLHAHPELSWAVGSPGTELEFAL